MKGLMRICDVLSVVVLVAGLLITGVVAQESSSQGGAKESASAQGAQKHKQARWEGIIIRSDKDNKTLTVRQRGSNLEKQVMYDDSTRWTSQEHGSKKVNNIDPSQVNDNDRVICLGTYDTKGVLHATLISKRLTQ